MIECCDENVWFKKKKRKNKRKNLIPIVIILVITGIFLYYKFVVTKQLSLVCSNFAYSYCTESVNMSVANTLDENSTYKELITIEKNNFGDIVLMSANSQKINKINKDIALFTEEILKQKMANGIKIPFMAFTGIKFLSGYGVPINFKSFNVTDVSCSFDSKFTSVGINQTLHSIYIEVLTNVSINLPFDNNKISYKNKILVCETILLGKVPEIYLNGKLFGNT